MKDEGAKLFDGLPFLAFGMKNFLLIEMRGAAAVSFFALSRLALERQC